MDIVIAELSIGAIHLQGVGADVSSSFGDLDIIGMNVLRRLRSWRVEQGSLVLNATP
jgi:aspartyl protease family protein